MSKLSDAAGADPIPDGLVFVHVDAHVVVVDKPSGLLSVPGRGAEKQDCAAARVQREYADALVVHRLDMATSGLLLMARGPVMQSRLGRAFIERQVGKRYMAVVAGRVERPARADETDGDWSLIDHPLAADWPNRPRWVVDVERGKPSQTRWRMLAYDPGSDTSRLELEPLTGRSHQLRVHLQALGHPILGDRLYAPAHIQERAPRLLLHATELKLSHPFSGEAAAWSSTAPF